MEESAVLQPSATLKRDLGTNLRGSPTKWGWCPAMAGPRVLRTTSGAWPGALLVKSAWYLLYPKMCQLVLPNSFKMLLASVTETARQFEPMLCTKNNI